MIIITGASDGLGKEVAKLYTDEGKKVIGLSRGECEAKVEHIKCNLMDEESIKNAVEKILKMKEPIEAVINCAAVMSIEKLDKLTVKELDKVLFTNLRAPMILISRLFERIKKDGADILNVVSTVGHKAYADQASYGVSKWGLRGFNANLQLELKDTPCRVISFCPGGFKTKMFFKATGVDNTLKPGVWMSAVDIAKVIKYILSLPKNMEVSEIIINRKISL